MHTFVEDIPTSWATYLQTVAAVVASAPESLLLHLAGPTDQGVRVIQVWDSIDSERRFRVESLDDAIDQVTAVGAPCGYRPLEVRHAIGEWARSKPLQITGHAQ